MITGQSVRRDGSALASVITSRMDGDRVTVEWASGTASVEYVCDLMPAGTIPAADDSAAAYAAWDRHALACHWCQFPLLRGVCALGAGIRAWIGETEMASLAAEGRPAIVLCLCGCGEQSAS